jgi:hypothetical protein
MAAVEGKSGQKKMRRCKGRTRVDGSFPRHAHGGQSPDKHTRHGDKQAWQLPQADQPGVLPSLDGDLGRRVRAWVSFVIRYRITLAASRQSYLLVAALVSILMVAALVWLLGSI